MKTRGILGRFEELGERHLLLAHGANVFPLLHVVVYYAVWLILLAPGAPQPPLWRWALWPVLVLANFSISVGVLHMHAHRRLFKSAAANRVLELLLALPAGATCANMLYTHVFLHHRYGNDTGDPTSTIGYERGPRMLWYWVRFGAYTTYLTWRALFRLHAPRRWRRMRRRFVIDLSACFCVGVGLGVAGRYGLIDRWGWLLVFLVPACICHVNTGYFAWLTHQRVSGGRFEALNNVANVLAVLSHNQGFHSVHHKHPSLHWTEIPDHVGEMLDVSDSLIVPYWMTMTSAWRALHPAGVLAPMFGGAWKTRCRRALSAQKHRARRVPYFCWID